jgi:hypothetical protein
MKHLLLVLVVGCSSTPKEPVIPKEKYEQMCRPSVQHLVDLITTGETGGVALADKIRTALFDRCVNDKWGPDAITCFEHLATIDKASTCAQYLTVPQRDGFQQAIEEASR